MVKRTPVGRMKLYPLFLLMATAAVFSPGPGVVMTLTNSLRYGYRGTIGGIFGIAVGTFVVAAISATGLGVILATSALAFTILKFAGAAYLAYLGVRLWRSPVYKFETQVARQVGFGRRFAEGMSLTLTNPKAIFFFLSVFPQFIDPAGNFFAQFLILALTFSSLVVVIHTLYALFARYAKSWLTSERGGRSINRAGGLTFMFFGAVLATARQ